MGCRNNVSIVHEWAAAELASIVKESHNPGPLIQLRVVSANNSLFVLQVCASIGLKLWFINILGYSPIAWAFSSFISSATFAKNQIVPEKVTCFFDLAKGHPTFRLVFKPVGVTSPYGAWFGTVLFFGSYGMYIVYVYLHLIITDCTYLPTINVEVLPEVRFWHHTL